MKIAVIGLGSMGRRRIRLIRKYDTSFQIVGVDTNQERRVQCEVEYQIKTYAGAEAIKGDGVDCAFICTSPLSHSKIITSCLDFGWHVFSELNLVSDGYAENVLLSKNKGLVLFLSSTFLYRDEIKKIHELVNSTEKPLNYVYHVGQYLPDWHPWEDYNNFFVADKRSNGCREIFAIELPWIVCAFGDIETIESTKSKMSGLKVDYNDNYLLLIQHKSGHKGVLAVDVVSRKAVRNLEVFGEELYIHWDGSPAGLYRYDYDKKEDVNIELYEEVDQLENYSGFVVENAYFSEVVAFFKAVTEGSVPEYGFEKDEGILQIIDRIEA